MLLTESALIFGRTGITVASENQKILTMDKINEL